MRKATVGLGFSLVVLLSGCSEIGETTAVGAATGGVIGAGLGAVIGSQTGNAGTGLAIGAAAGASAGAAIGHALEGQDKAMARQDETISRQERKLAAQSSEIEELRRSQSEPRTSRLKNRDIAYAEPRTGKTYQPRDLKADSSSGRQKTGTGSSYKTASRLERPDSSRTSTKTSSARAEQAKASTEVLTEKTLVAADAGAAPALNNPGEASPAEVARESAAEKLREPSAPVEPKLADAGKAAALAAGSDDCAKAADEIQSAERAPEAADRLFHYRRALRLCPQSADYHNRLGEAYLSLNRGADAEYEFKEALNIDPGFSPAKENLSSIKK